MWSGSEEGSYLMLIDCCIRLESNTKKERIILPLSFSTMYIPGSWLGLGLMVKVMVKGRGCCWVQEAGFRRLGLGFQVRTFRGRDCSRVSGQIEREGERERERARKSERERKRERKRVIPVNTEG